MKDQLKAIKKALKKTHYQKTLNSTKSLNNKPTSKEKSFAELLDADLIKRASSTSLKIEHHEKMTDIFYVSDFNNQKNYPKSAIKKFSNKKVFTDLKKGDLPIAYTLDLHGYSLESIDELLSSFCEIMKNKKGCGRVIHGVGMNSEQGVSVVKQKVIKWLYENPQVLAYNEEKFNDGATLVLVQK